MPPIHQVTQTGASQASQSAQNAQKMTGHLSSARAAGGGLLKILKDMVSPLALATGATLGFVGILAKAVIQTEAMHRGLIRITRINYYAPSFAKLLGGLDQAKRRLAEISAMAAKGPFKFDDMAVGNRRLEILSRGRLSGKQGMNLTGDAAAAGGTSFTEMASSLGTLYDDISNGRDIGSGIEQLRLLGVISNNTANRLLMLRQSGVSNAEMWREVEAEVSRTKGSMSALAKEIGGLQEKLENARGEQDRSIGEMFEDGQKKGLEARIQMVESMTPVLQAAMGPVAWLRNGWSELVLQVTNFLGKVPGLKQALATVASTISALALGALAISLGTTIVLIVKLTLALFSWAKANVTAAGATGMFAKSVTALGAALRFLVTPLGLLGIGLALIAGALLEAGNNSSMLSARQKKLRQDLEDTTKALREQIASTKTQADRAENTSAAQKRVIDLEEKIAAAKKVAAEQEKQGATQGRRVGGYWNKTLFGIKPGEEVANDTVTELQEERAAAMQDVMRAASSPTDSATESLLGEDYAKEKAASEAKIAQYNKEFEALQKLRAAAGVGMDQARRDGNEARAGEFQKIAEDLEGKMEQIAGATSMESDRFSADNINRRFDQRQISGDIRIRSMREIARQTGDTELRSRADQEEDDLFKEKRKREFIGQGFQGPEAELMSEQDMVLGQMERERNRTGSPQVSALAGAGLSGGWAGIVNDIPKQQLDRLRTIEEELKRIASGFDEQKIDRENEE